MATQFDIREKINQQIISSLEKGGLPPWKKPWRSQQNTGIPINITSRRPYRGINLLLIALHQERYGFQSRYFGTFDQWRQVSGKIQRRPDTVRNGEWGAGIIFYNSFTKTIEDEITGSESEKEIYFLRQYTVFCIDQVEGLHLDRFRAEKNNSSESSFIDYAPAESFISSIGADISYGYDKACYSPSTDKIFLPNKQDFDENSPNEFYATAFHELLHWSEQRCGWSGSYAEGELRAEIGAAYLMNELKVPQSNDFTNHFSYLDHWIQQLKRDNRFILRASAAASKAVDFLLVQTGFKQLEHHNELAST